MAINPKIKQKAEDIRKKIFGAEVRESLASGLEGMSEDVESIKGRQGNVESQFQNVIDETTGKDVISAPELIAARNGKSNLKTRLDDEHAEVTAQLQQKVGNGKLATANDLDEDLLNFIHDGTGGQIVVESVPKNRSVTPEKTDFFTFSQNLFNKNSITLGKYVLKTGEISHDFPNAFISERIKLEADVKYAIPQEYYGSRIRFEDDNGNLLGTINEDSLPATNGVFSTTQNCFAIFSQNGTNSIDTYMVIKSDTPISKNDYIPFFPPYIKKTNIEELEEIAISVDTLNADVTEIKNTNSIFNDIATGYGDSLTAGTGGNGTTYLTVLQTLLTANGNDTTTINRGGGGETCNGINARIGAFPIKLNPFTLPADTSPVVVTTKAFGGETVNNLNRFMRGVNPCYIDGIKCTLSRLSDADTTLYLKRDVAGTSVVFDKPKRLLTDGYLNDRNANVFIVWMGTNNDTYTAEQIIQKQRLFVDTIKTDKYIILGITQDNEPNRISHNNAMAQEWGSHFLDIREYIIEYGLKDMGITPTTADTDAIALGKIPPSLLFDDTHFNEYGYTVIGQQVYKLGKLLGYWK